ncbi:hypothetical protein [Aliamphritea spongicola]|nr:hypothetical protein [Aliamphritea spongicola]
MVYELSPLQAGLVLGSALAVKMVAYLGVAPVVGGYSHAFPRRSWLAGLNLGRAVIVILLPFATEIWQIFVLIFSSMHWLPVTPLCIRRCYRMSCRMKMSIPEHCRCPVWRWSWKVSSVRHWQPVCC